MYSLNGVALDNTFYGWKLRSVSVPLLSHTREVVNLRVPGRHGAVRVPDAPAAPPVWKIVVETPKANLEALYALLTADVVRATITATPTTRELDLELLTIEPEGFGPADSIVDVTAIFRVPDGYWRDVSETTTTATTITTASQDVDFWTGLSGHVADPIVRVKGSITSLVVTDAGTGAWFSYAPNITSTNYLRFHPAEKKAYLTTSNTWTGGTDVSGTIDFGGHIDGFRISPYLISPLNRVGRLNVASSARSAATIEVRGKRAYAV